MKTMKLPDNIRGVLRAAGMLFLLFVALQTAVAQDAIILGPIDTSQWPILHFRIRLLIGGVDTELPDPGRLEFFEETVPLVYSLRCDDPAPAPLALALGLERSLDSYFPHARDAAMQALALTRSTDAADRVALWTFATLIDHDLSLSRDSARAASLILATSVANWPLNGTILFETMYRAVEEVGSAPELLKAVLFVTDGVNNTVYSNRDAAGVINRAVSLGVPVHVIGIRQVDAGLAEMRAIAAATGGTFHHVTEAGVFDSLALALRGSIVSEHWCDIETQSRFCANGATRRLFCRYITENNDTLRTSLTYVSPFLPGDLDTLVVWSSPLRATLGPNDTVVVALGVTLINGVQPPSFTLALPLRGAGLVSAVPLEWQMSPWKSGDTLYLDVVPPAAGLTDGDYPLARVLLTSSAAMSLDVVPTLLPRASSCLYAMSGSVRRSARMALDTIRAERGATEGMPIRIYDSGLPEGVQDAVFGISVDTAHARFDTAAPWSDTPGWRGSWTLIDAGTLQVRLYRLAPDADVLAGRANITTLYTAPLHVPVMLEVLAVNEYGPRPLSIPEAGLIVLSDSCHPVIVMLSGVAMFPPWPNPANAEVLLDFAAIEETSITLQLLDESGRPAFKQRARLGKGLSTLRLHIAAVPSGSYSILCLSKDGSTTGQLRIVR